MQTHSLESEQKQSEDYQNLIEKQIEIEACSKSSTYFLKKYGKIRDKNRGIIPWEPWPHLLYYLECLRKHRFVVFLKPKQIGATWTINLDNLHLAMFKEGANILTLSKSEDTAAESLDYAHFAHSQLPDFLHLPLGKERASLLTFPTVHSKIRALPSTEDAGVGFGGAARVVLDEFEYHPYDRKNYSEILPPILDGGQLIIQSTADKLKVGTLFKELYVAARAGDNNFYPIFFPYDVLPNRTQEWYDNIDLPDWQKECRYPKTEKEALETLGTRAVYDRDILEQMKAGALQPIPHELSDKYKGWVKIFKPPAVGGRYCVFSDPSDGKEDPHATIVIDAVSGEQMAESHGKVTADICAQIHHDLVCEYNNALNSYEMNARAGGLFSAKVAELNTPNQSKFVKPDGSLDDKKTGWWTGKALKDKMVWGLEEAIRNYQVRIHSIECINELLQFIIPEGKDPQATPGAHDDYVIAWGGVQQIRKYTPRGGIKVTSVKYG